MIREGADGSRFQVTLDGTDMVLAITTHTLFGLQTLEVRISEDAVRELRDECNALLDRVAPEVSE